MLRYVTRLGLAPRVDLPGAVALVDGGGHAHARQLQPSQERLAHVREVVVAVGRQLREESQRLPY
jgi:hypothetical protein